MATIEEFWNHYQDETQATAVYPGQGSITGLSYVGLKFAGESGEVSEHIGKALRDDAGEITDDRKLLLSRELGDVLWYIARGGRELGVRMSHVGLADMTELGSVVIPGRGTSTARTCMAFGLTSSAGRFNAMLLEILTKQAGNYDTVQRDEMVRLLGLALYWLTQLAQECGLDLQAIADENLEKLRKRKDEGTLHGSGSNR